MILCTRFLGYPVLWQHVNFTARQFLTSFTRMHVAERVKMDHDGQEDRQGQARSITQDRPVWHSSVRPALPVHFVPRKTSLQHAYS